MNPLEKTISFFTPYDCLLCGREDDLICKWCIHDAFESVPSRCFLCKQATDNFATCKKCLKKAPLGRVFVTSPYNQTAKELIHSMKIGSVRQGALIIARHMDNEAPFLKDCLVMNVATVPAHVRQRGFDHTKLFAKEFAHLRGLPYSDSLRRFDKSKQVGAGRKQRMTQLKGVFEVADGFDKNVPVLLVDDVTTTGSTIVEAAKALRKAGVKHVDALVFAQTI